MARKAVTPKAPRTHARDTDAAALAAQLRDLASPLDGATPSMRDGDPPVDVGKHLGGRYRIVRQLGRGGMGAVFLAVDEVLGKEVALKFVNEDVANLDQLRAEVLLAQKVTHVNVCRTYDLEEADGHFIVKMEYVDGELLSARIDERRGMAEGEALRVARAVVSGLAAAHAQGVIHCDLKPENTFIEAHTGRVVLMDFGIARAGYLAPKASERSDEQPAVRDRDLRPAGTPEYMSPEQARGLPLDPRADLYSLGCMLYHMLVGEVPFPAATAMDCALRQINDPPPDPRARRRDLPPWLARLVLRLLDKDPARRYPDADSVARALVGPAPLVRRASTVGALALLATLGIALVALRPWRARHDAPVHPAWHPQVSQAPRAFDENADPPRVSPDGKLLAYYSDRDGPWRIYVEPAAGGTSHAITPGGTLVTVPTWTHDGQVLFVTLADMTLRQVPPTGGPSQVVATGVQNGVDCGGRLVLLRSGAPGCPQCTRLVVRDGGGAAERDLARFESGSSIDRLECDRQGRRVTYALGRLGAPTTKVTDVWVAALDGGAPRRLTTDSAANDYPAFHPDGRSVIYSSVRDGALNVWEVSVDGGPSVQITTEGQALVGDVSPDGKLLYYDADTTSQPIGEFDLTTHAHREITRSLDSYAQINVPPDGKHLVALVQRGGTSVATVLPLDDGDERVLGEADAIALSLDGSVVYSSRTRGTPERSMIVALPFAGGAERPIAELDGRVVSIRTGSDGFLHLSVPSGRGALRVPIAGGKPELEAPAPTYVIAPAPRGDATFLISPAAAGPLLDVRIVRGPHPAAAPTVATLLSASTAWMPDGESLLYWDLGTIREHRIAGGPDRVVMQIEQINGFAPSPDGKKLYVIETRGRARRQILTNFGDHERPVAGASG